MRRGRSGIGAELVPLVLILASLAGSLVLVIAIHRRFVARSTVEKQPVAIVSPPLTASTKPKPISLPSAVVPETEAEEPEPPPPPPPEDPTPKVLSNLMAAEAEQLLEASKADRKAAALEEARKAAIAESERWRRRESLVRLQLDSLETKVHQLETQADELALERDALEREIDARKALAAQDRSRPSTAILPHRGQNGTWRRPIVVECVNGMAVIRPQGISFGMLELASGFGPTTNPFVATIAREAIRIQGNASPDGQLVTPYIFFLVRPDGIRTYYEARGRLEALGITFGYELADQDWEIDFPDLDDIKTWDGSGPLPTPRIDPRAQIRSQPPGATPAEDESLPNLGIPTPGNSQARAEGPGSEFTWPPQSRVAPSNNGRVNLGGTGSSTGSGGIGNSGGTRGYPAGGHSGGLGEGSNPGTGTLAQGGLGGSGGGGGGRGNGGIKFPGGTSGATTPSPISGTGLASDDLPPLSPPRELAIGGPITPLQPNLGGNPGSPTPPTGSTEGNSPPPPPPTSIGSISTGLPPVVSPRTSPPRNSGGSIAPPSETSTAGDPTDPPSPYVLPSPGLPPNQIGASRPSSGSGNPPLSPNQTPPVRHIGPFSKPLAAGLDPALITNASSPPPSTNVADDPDPTQPDTFNSGSITEANGSINPSQPPNSNSSANPNPTASQKPGSGSTSTRVIGLSDSSTEIPPGSPPPPLTVGMSSTGTPPTVLPFGSPSSMPTPPPPDSTSPPKSSRPKTPPVLPDSKNFKIVDKSYEIVVVCNARGVIVQPGAYRVTAQALKSRDGLLKTEIVSLVKARRTLDPKQTIEPRVRFLVQPGGEGTYWTARSQFLLSGLDWPISTQVADRDALSVIPSESW
jgi:hypothetical protein